MVRNQWGVSVLANYRVYRLDGAGKIMSADWLTADDDEHAARLAGEVDYYAALEVWDRNRLVARITPEREGRPEA